MTPTTETELTPDLIDRGMKLSPADRQRFARLLLDSVGDEDGYTEEELHAELDRRWSEYQRGEVQAIPIADFLKRLDSRIAERLDG